MKEFRGRSTDGRSRFHPIQAGPGASGAAQLFIHRANDGRVLLIPSFAGPGAPAAARSTSAFEIAGTSLKKSTDFGGYQAPGSSMRTRIARSEEPLETRYVK